MEDYERIVGGALLGLGIMFYTSEVIKTYTNNILEANASGGSRHTPLVLMKPKKVKDIDKYLDDDNYYLDKKMDGYSCQIIISKENGKPVVDIWAGSGKNNWNEHLPHIVKEIELMANNGLLMNGDIIVGEVYVGKGETIEERRTIAKLNGKPHTALEYQQDNGWFKFAIFTKVNPAFPDKTEEHRTMELSAIKNKIGKQLKYVEFLPKYDSPRIKQIMFKKAKSNGWEGLVFKDKKATYIFDYDKTPRSSEWFKYKFEDDADVVIYGVMQEEDIYGNLKQRSGSVLIGVFDDNGNFVKIGRCGGMNDAEKDRMWQHFSKSILSQQTTIRGKHGNYPAVYTIEQFFDKNCFCGEIEYQGWGKNAPTHPRLIRFRQDKKPTECLMSQFK